MRITLGVTGGIAAYKSAELVRRLQDEGHSIQVVMTRAAREFITPLTFAALSGQRVITDLFSKSAGRGRRASIPPSIISPWRSEPICFWWRRRPRIFWPSLRAALPTIFLRTLYLAVDRAGGGSARDERQHVAARWQHRRIVATLRARGVHIVEPSEGYLACGMTGSGRLAEQEEILKAVREVLQAKQDLAGETVLVTAGPTCEDIDPVRFLTNRSSGKDGLCGGCCGGAAWRESGSGQRSDLARDAARGGARRMCAAREEMQSAVQASFSGMHDGDLCGGGCRLPASREVCARRSSAARKP